MQSLLTTKHKQYIKSANRFIAEHKFPYQESANQLLQQMLAHMSIDEVERHQPEYWATVVNDLIGDVTQVDFKDALVNVFNPKQDDDVTIIQMVNPNIPFLVDSAILACGRLGLSVELLSHPIINVGQDEDGRRVIKKKTGKLSAEVRSLIYLEVNRVNCSERLSEISSCLEQLMVKIHRAVADWKPMMAVMQQVADDLAAADTPTASSQRRFLNWLLDNHFTLLGYRKYQLQDLHLAAESETGLGLLHKSMDSSKYELSEIPASRYQADKQIDLLLLTKLNVISDIHRKTNLDCISVLETNREGDVIAEHRFIGLFTSSAVSAAPLEVPFIKRKVKQVIRRFGFDAESHSGKTLISIVNNLPRDEVFQSNAQELFDTVYQILMIQEKVTTEVIARIDSVNRYACFMVFVPRDLFNTQNRQKIQQIIIQQAGGEAVEFTVAIDDSHHARLYFVVKNIEQLDNQLLSEIGHEISEKVKTWDDRLRQALKQRFEAETVTQYQQQFTGVFPAVYMEEVSPWVASFDVEHAAKLVNDDDIEMSLYEPKVKRQGEFRFKVFRFNNTIPLSEVLPHLENLGLHVVSERPYELSMKDGKKIWIQDFDLKLAGGGTLVLESVRERFHQAFAQVVKDNMLSDTLNQLIIFGGLRWRQVFLLRAMVKYLLQTGLPYSNEYIMKALVGQPHIARWLVELFEVRFKPELESLSGKELRSRLDDLQQRFKSQIERLGIELTEYQQESIALYCRSRKLNRDNFSKKITKIISALLESVQSQDEDQIIRAVRHIIFATLRTNFYQVDTDGLNKPAVSFKIDSSKVPFLPKPVPFREIFVYSTRVEATHLRMGKVARGGLRWSDRYEDFRTEVLGLMKAQNVKNSIIVPVGSKGGFVVKKMPKGSRDEVMAEVIDCYKTFIGSMLDITDNIKGEQIINPPQVIRYDEDDPYLVVAADKGTATFSDIANGISEERGFWLGDAFASGGSAGYDHKGMGITARGAWESVKRHFREIGIDSQSQDFSVVGIGDMMGDVFGNGMLLSKHICLKAAFNHMHIFLDPSPNAAKSWTERKRLFELPRSTWEDYNQDLISKGGGVYSRFDKSISLSDEVKAWLKIKEDELSPQELIKKLLSAEVDLLWNGGIGTYVKSSAETHAEVGDSANNVLRVNGKQLRCKIIGEGGNLGMTQRGRIEYAENGGRLNADFIDNSAGVDCSDHEVNIKILLKSMMEDGHYDKPKRNQLLASMTDNVSELVLNHNYRQTQTLSFMQYLSAGRIGAKAHLIRTLEEKGILDREIEFLPSDAELERRRVHGEGLSRPELCVLLSYAKLDLFQQLSESDVLEDAWLHRLMVNYFPKKLQKVDDKYLSGHRLKDEIINTVLVSQVIDRMGATFVMRMNEDTGAGVAAICKAFFIVVELFDLNKLWEQLEAHDLTVEATQQTERLIDVWKFVRRAIRWTLNNYGHDLDIAVQIEQLKPGVQQFTHNLSSYVSSADVASIERDQKALDKKGFKNETAERLSILPYLSASLDVVNVAQKAQLEVKQVAELYFPLGKFLNLTWLQNMVQQLLVENQWHVYARGGLSDDLNSYHAQLVASLLEKYDHSTDADKIIATWSEQHKSLVQKMKNMMLSVKSEKKLDYPTIMVAVNALSLLVGATK